jgi:hypothetical protein
VQLQSVSLESVECILEYSVDVTSYTRPLSGHTAVGAMDDNAAKAVVYATFHMTRVYAKGFGA